MGRKRKKPNPSIEGEKRREKKNGQPLPATTEEGEFRRNWLELPDLALHSIFRRLVSIPDLLSFSSVCRSWNSLSSTSNLSTSFPPLLLLPVLQNPNPSSPLRARRRPTWSQPPRCRLQTLETLGRRSFQSKIPYRTLALRFLGYSNGHLIFKFNLYGSSSSSSNFLLLANVFSGQTTRIPLPFPSLSPFPRIALLTDTGLFLASDSLTLSYHRATASWSQLNHGAESLAVSSRDSNQLFSIDRYATNLRVIEFAPASDSTSGGIRSEPMQVPSPPLSGSFICNEAHRLVDRGGELLLLHLGQQFPPPMHWRIDVFKLDPERSTWVEVENLGNWCLFVDTVGSCATACPEPGRWGGRSNCVYVTGPGCDSWVLVPLDGDRLFTICELGVTKPLWPSPVWVYPSKLKYNYHNDI